MKAYQVDFDYSVDMKASLHVVARDEDEAKAGAIEVLKAQGVDSPEVRKVKEVQKEDQKSDVANELHLN